MPVAISYGAGAVEIDPAGDPGLLGVALDRRAPARYISSSGLRFANGVRCTDFAPAAAFALIGAPTGPRRTVDRRPASLTP